jgi:ribosome-associated protein
MREPHRRSAPAPGRSLELARQAARICDEKRAEEIVILDLQQICDFTDFFVIATATSGPQMKGLVRALEKALKAMQAPLLNRDGSGTSRWALLYYGDTVVHIFDAEAREFYQLEHLWGDAPRLDF